MKIVLNICNDKKIFLFKIILNIPPYDSYIDQFWKSIISFREPLVIFKEATPSISCSMEF